MTTQVLTPTQDVPDGAGLNITALLATPTATTLLFSNTGRERLIVVPGAGAEPGPVHVGPTVRARPAPRAPPSPDRHPARPGLDPRPGTGLPPPATGQLSRIAREVIQIIPPSNV